MALAAHDVDEASSIMHGVIHSVIKGEQCLELLNAVYLLKDMESRHRFLDICWQMSPFYRLSNRSYALMSDLLRVALRESNNQRDFQTVMRIFNVSSLFSATKAGANVPLKAGIRSHEAWQNKEFWVFCSTSMLQNDLANVRAKQLISSDLFAMSTTDFEVLLAVIRLQAICRSMCTLHLKSNFIRSVVADCVQDMTSQFHFETASVQIEPLVYNAPTPAFVSWALSVALFASSQEVIDKNRTIEYDSRPRHVELGFSSLQHVLFYSINHLCGTPSATRQELCCCGIPLGGWQPLGLYETNSKYESLPTLLCEQCYRMLSADPLSSPRTRSGCAHILGRAVVPLAQPVAPSNLASIFNVKRPEV